MTKRKIFNRIGVCLFVVIICFCVFFINKKSDSSYAINTDVIPSELSSELVSYSDDFYGENGDPITGISIRPYYGNPVDDPQTVFDFFCLNRNMGWADNFSFVKSSDGGGSSKLPYQYVVLAIHEVNGYNYEEGLERYLRQIAVWLYEYEQAGKPTDVNDPNYMSSEEIAEIESSAYYGYISALLTAAKNAEDPFIVPPVANINYDGKWSVEGDNIVTSEISVIGDSFSSYIVSLPNVAGSFILVDGENVPAGTNIDVSKKFKISIPIDNIDVNNVDFSINVNSNYEAYEAHRYIPNDAQESCQEVDANGKTVCDKVQDILTFIKRKNSVQNQVNLSIPTGEIKIAKVKEGNVSIDGNNLAGANLCITSLTEDDCTNAIYDFTSTNSVSTYELIPGNYKVIEKSAPFGYLTTNKTYEFNIDSDGIVSINGKSDNLITIENSSTKVTINKIDSDTSQNLSGAVIQIYKISDDNSRTLVNTVTSTADANGVEVVNSDGSPLAFGNYIAIETKAPDGYLLNDEEQKFTLSENNYNINIKIKNFKNKIEIIKLDQEQQSLDGASFVVTSSINSIDNPIYSCVSGDDVNPCVFTQVNPGTYYIHEVSAPSGYQKSDEVKEVIITNQTKDIFSFTYVNTKKGLSILKTDKNGHAISGATLVLNNSSDECDKDSCVPFNNDENYKWVSSKDAKDISDLPVGVYYIHEISAPNGYVIDSTPQQIVIEDGVISKQFTFVNDVTKISIEKVDENNIPVSGAVLAIYKGKTIYDVKQENFVLRFTTDGTPYDISKLEFGDYILYEEKAATGYYASNNVINFNVDQNTKNLSIKMVNKAKQIKIVKVDKDDNYVSGAELALFDENNNQIGNSWFTSDAEHSLGLLANGTYCIKELKAPDGYIKNNDSKCFVVDENTTNMKVKFENEQIVLRLAKVDSSTGEYIPGALLKLSRKDGSMTPITFTSTEFDYEIKGIRAGEYILEEVNAPVGYITSDSKIEFNVYETGKVQAKRLISNNITISIMNKKLVIDSNGIDGFKFRLYDANGVVEDINVGDNIYTSKELNNGEYYLEEVDVPKGYTLNYNKLIFYVTDSNNEVIKFSNDYTKVSISKRDITNGNEIPGAHLELKDEDGNIIEKWTSTTTEHVINRKLEAGKTYYLKETIAPTGYEVLTNEISFTVNNNGQVKAVVMDNVPKIDVPDTSKSGYVIYIIIGSIILLFGSLMVSIALKRYKNSNV